jgi:3-oxoacyl-[acyl-carrier protein] reductase
MDLGIAKKKALVCGASKGIGRAIALAIAEEGAEVFLCSRGEAALKELAAEISKKYSVKAEYAACDLTDPAAQQILIKEVQSKFGNVDILIHNTGGPSPTHAQDTSIEKWQQGFDQLFKAVVALNLAFLPNMKKQRWGRIIAVTSLSVMEPIANLVVSNAIRSSVTAMLKTLSDEVAGENITVNCVAPGAIQTWRIEDLIRTRAEKAEQT